MYSNVFLNKQLFWKTPYVTISNTPLISIANTLLPWIAFEDYGVQM
jgi:hypothetical protein